MSNPFAIPGLKVTMYPKIKAWSYSVVSNHATCPLKVRFAKIDRLPEPPSQAMERGLQVHRAFGAAIEHRVDQNLLSPEWYAKALELNDCKATSEKQLAFTVDWIPVEWFAGNVWGRVVIDAVYEISPGIIQVIELKTGKVYPEHTAQLRLYALAGFIMYPHATEVRAENWYCDGPPIPHAGYVAQRSALPRLKEEFAAFAQALLNDDLFPARPGRHCNWCNFSRSKNGPCQQG
jgi:CRISPR/Cas system-associated exonuclease Cas4 (RecB family)